MKKLLVLILTCAYLIGCTTSQQNTTYKTLYSLETTTTATYDGYIAAVAKGTVPTNAVPSVSKKYNDFQASLKLAVALAQNNTNALAPANLQVEAQDLINVITQLEGGK